jgi:hypothetical protein
MEYNDEMVTTFVACEGDVGPRSRRARGSGG